MVTQTKSETGQVSLNCGAHRTETKLKAFDAPEASVSDFLILDGKHHNLIWNTKDLLSREFDAWPAPTQSTDEVRFIGTLRPLYAQELQRSVLNDLGRIGLAVAPAIGMSASVKVILRKKGGALSELPLKGLKGASVYVVPSRGGGDKSMIIFVRRFIASLLAALKTVNVDELVNNAKGNFNQLSQPKAYEKMTKLFKSGLPLEEPVDMGIYLTARSKPTSLDASAWCWICVSMELSA